MFNKLAIRILAKENANLRSQLRRKDKQISELLDNFIFHKIPERLATRSFSSPSGTGGTVSAYPPSSEHMSDAYSTLIRDLEAEIDNAEPVYTIVDPEEEDD